MARLPFTKRRLILPFIFVAIISGGVFVFRNAGRWLVHEDPIAQADAIVVLSGGMPYRAEGAADLYKQKLAPEVWITRHEDPGQELAEMGIRFVPDEEYSREVLVHEGVPANVIRILPEEIINTEDEVNEIAQEMKGRSNSRVIITTSPPHTRRVRALWTRLAGPGQVAIIEAAEEDSFDRDHWWRNTHDTYAVVREYMGLINIWTGLTIRPHRLGK